MPWDAQGHWTPDEPVQTAPVAEQIPVDQQAGQLTGLLANGGAPAATTTPTATSTATPAAADTPPAPGDASVSGQLTGLLDSNSPYMKQAKQAGLRVAGRRGLLNSSIAAGSSEAAAIAAAAPIASQDAAQIHARNQSQLEGDINLRNATTLQTQQDAAALARQQSGQEHQINLQTLGDSAAMARLIEQGGIERALQEMRESGALTQTQMNANVSLLSNYMSAFAELSKNPDLPASARDAYMREFLRVTQSGQALVNALAGVTVTWPGSTSDGTVATPPPITTTNNPTSSSGSTSGSSGGSSGGGGWNPLTGLLGGLFG